MSGGGERIGAAASPRLAYERARALARDRDAKVRRRLAARSDVAPEILYYLAEDRDPGVRRAIAANLATPRHADLLLAVDPDDEVRIGLARKIGRLAPGLTARQQDRLQTLTVEALNLLADDALPRVRQAIAEAIKTLDSVPREVVDRLARDVELIVAAPILEYSPLLSDDDLLEIITSEPVQGALSAISRRRGLASPVCDAIAASEDAPAIAVLLENSSAQIREETLDSLIARAPGHETWHRPLAARPTLSEAAARRIACLVSASLISELERANRLPPEVARAVAERVESRLETDPEPPQAEAEARQRFEAGSLDDEVMRRRIDRYDREFVVHSLTLMTSMKREAVDRILRSFDAGTIVALAWKAGLSMPTAIDLQVKIAGLDGDSILSAEDGVGYPMAPTELEARLAHYLQ
jgi:uncharacterized protein (DUF2336 family)